MSEQILVIGNGISGVSCARHIRKHSDASICIISAETEHFFSRTALMYIYMGHMRYKDTKPYEDDFWSKNGIDLKFARVERLDHTNRKLILDSSEEMHFDKLVIATGSSPNKFGWPGQDLKGVQGLYSKQDLDAMEAASKGLKRAVVVGGGLIGIEMAEMFRSRDIPVSLLVRESAYWDNVLPKEEAELVSDHIRAHEIDLHLSTELDSIQDDGAGKLAGIRTKDGNEIACGFVGLTVGVHPNIDFLKDSGLETDRGILVNRDFSTNLEGVFAIGDCAQFREPHSGRAAIEQVWYTGRMHGECLGRSLGGKPTNYIPGPWFNSAKFLDIEYQVYGNVPTQLPSEGIDSLLWISKEKKRSIRLVYRRSDQVLVGVNLMGVRYRHALCDKWLREEWTLSAVIPALKAANFDPEFSEMHEEEMSSLYNGRFPDSPLETSTINRGWDSFLQVFKSKANR